MRRYIAAAGLLLGLGLTACQPVTDSGRTDPGTGKEIDLACDMHFVDYKNDNSGMLDYTGATMYADAPPRLYNGAGHIVFAALAMAVCDKAPDTHHVTVTIQWCHLGSCPDNSGKAWYVMSSTGPDECNVVPGPATTTQGEIRAICRGHYDGCATGEWRAVAVANGTMGDFPFSFTTISPHLKVTNCSPVNYKPISGS